MPPENSLPTGAGESPYFPPARSWADNDGTVHYDLDRAAGGGKGPAWWTSENDVNPVCGCHLANLCRGCGVCTSCDGCFCEEGDY